jgi:hypothetical protein
MLATFGIGRDSGLQSLPGHSVAVPQWKITAADSNPSVPNVEQFPDYLDLSSPNSRGATENYVPGCEVL